MAKDYYKILGVDKNADEAQLKKAYRKKSIEWHPDKWQDKSEAERKKAEEQFKLVAEAYDCLKDPDKRARYDQFGDNWEQMNQGGDFGGFGGFEDIMSRMSGGVFDDFFGGGRRQNRGPKPGQSVQTQYEIGINEIFNGLNTTFEFEVNGRCTKCNGSGGDSETCSHCHGTGNLTQTQHTPFGMITQQSMCPYCHGTGKVITKKCTECNGTGIKKIKRKVNLNIKPFVENGHIMKFTGMGYESKDPHGLNGDLLIQIIYNIDTSKYVVKGKTVYEKIKIPYYDVILGTKLNVTLPNNTKETIEIKPLSQEGTQIVLHNKGISGGDYIYIVSLQVPNKNIANNEKELLNQIKQLH